MRGEADGFIISVTSLGDSLKQPGALLSCLLQVLYDSRGSGRSRENSPPHGLCFAGRGPRVGGPHSNDP